jgi:Mrp family chromosome partitioning ATPase
LGIGTATKSSFFLRENRGRAHRGELAPSAYTLQEMARLLKVAPHWFRGRIKDGTLKIEKDPRYGCFLFPKDQQTVEQLKRLKNRRVPYVSIQTPYSVGCGKTTTTAALGVLLGRSGIPVHIVDMDPQASLSRAFGQPTRPTDCTTASPAGYCCQPIRLPPFSR